MTPGALEAEAEAWIADYFNARHLIRTRDWVVILDPQAGEDLRIAALTHDIERRVPGGPPFDPAARDWEDPGYVLAHSTRSAAMVSEWLDEHGAAPEMQRSVERLILHHEIGGYPEADILQAADSLSFLEVNAGRAREWVAEGRCDRTQALEKLDQMRDRISVPAARPVANELHAAAAAALEKPFRAQRPARLD